jgi:hypothetical protein
LLFVDETSDFVLPGDRPNQWLTLQERDELTRRQEANLKKLETPTYRQRRVMTIDPITRSVKVEVIEKPVEADSKVPAAEPIAKDMERTKAAIGKQRERESTEAPKFIRQSEKAKEPSDDKNNNTNNKPRISRVQDNFKDVFGMTATMSDDSFTKLSEEPDCG